MKGVSQAVQVWNWCEWVRLSVIAAVFIAGGLALVREMAVERAQAHALHPPFRPAADTTRAIGHANPRTNVAAAIGDIRYSSDDQSTVVTVDLPGLVYFEAHRITGPERIYFDLQGTRMPGRLYGTPISMRVTEPFVRKIRVAEWTPGVTRVALEIKPGSDYSAMIASNPYRLVVNIHAPSTAK